MSLGLEPCISDAGLKTSKSQLCRSVLTSKGKTQERLRVAPPIPRGLTGTSRVQNCQWQRSLVNRPSVKLTRWKW